MAHHSAGAARGNDNNDVSVTLTGATAEAHCTTEDQEASLEGSAFLRTWRTGPHSVFCRVAL